MGRWQFVYADTAGNPQGELTAATNRSLVFNLDAGHTCSFTLPGLHAQAGYVNEGLTDIICNRRTDVVGQAPTLMFRGRVTDSEDTVSTEADTVDFTANDYRGLLTQSRFIWASDTLTYANVEQTTIGWDLIAATQAKTGGSWGITNGSTSTSTPRTETFNVGANVGDTITTLADTDGGFDWEIGPDLVYRTWFPARGRVGQVFLDYPGLVSGFSRGTSLSSWGNAVLSTGASTIASQAVQAATFGPAGRFEQVYSDPDINDTASLTKRANFELSLASQPPAYWQVILKPGTWDPADLWLGDVVGLYLVRGRLNVDQALRVTTIQIDIDEEGVETVTVTLGPVLLLRASATVPDSTATALDPSDSVVNSPAVKIPTLGQVLQTQSRNIAIAKRLAG